MMGYLDFWELHFNRGDNQPKLLGTLIDQTRYFKNRPLPSIDPSPKKVVQE